MSDENTIVFEIRLPTPGEPDAYGNISSEKAVRQIKEASLSGNRPVNIILDDDPPEP